MRIIYFDICAIPLFLIILYICHSRKMTKGTANRLFIAVVQFSLISAVTDLGMELISTMLPLSQAGVMLCSIFSYVYFAFRNGTNAVLLLFLLALTRTTFMLRKAWTKIVFSLPYAVVVIVLIQNLFTHNAFTITSEAGYSRGPLIIAFYAVAFTYGVTGFIYCIYCRRYLSTERWAALLSTYILSHLAVVIQFFHSGWLVEMFFTAISVLMIMLSIIRPEERMDIEVGMLSRVSYQNDISNIIKSGEHVQIAVIQMLNSRETRNYLGEYQFSRYISEVANDLREIEWVHKSRIEIYYERPGTIYLIADEDEPCLESIAEFLVSASGSHTKPFADSGVVFDPSLCIIRCPEDLNTTEDIISLGHIFRKLDNSNQTVVYARDIVHSQNFEIEAHIDDILDRAIKNNHLEMYYQPIYDVRSGKFRSAEALARIIDPEYGLVSPAIFIPAAETQGFIIPLGDMILDQVFRFISEHDMDVLGLSYIEINLSVAQCMEASLTDKIQSLQQKYGIDPGRVNLEITETSFINNSDVVLDNITRLIEMGYSFALDDYGIGYSSIHRINHIPLKLIKIDKSMLDEVSTENGRKILEHTVRMMQSIGKQLVAEGAETADEVGLLKNTHCDYVQGFYYSKPLPAEEFIRFLAEHNGRGMAG